MAKNKKAVVETVEEVKEEQKEEVVDKKAVVEKSSEYPKKYINTNQTELMFWNKRFSKGVCIIDNKQEEDLMMMTLDYQNWFISLTK